MSKASRSVSEVAVDQDYSKVQGAHEHDHSHDHSRTEDSCCATGEYEAPTAGLWAQAGQQVTRLRIDQMDCPVEEQLLRKKLEGQEQVVALQFNLMQRQLEVLHVTGYQGALLDAVVSLGMKPQLMTDEDSALAPQATTSSKKTLIMICSAVVIALVAELGVFLDWPLAVIMPMSALAIVLTGGGVYKKGLIALRNRNLNINALMSIAVTGAVLLGEWPEAAMVMSLFALAEYIEARSLDRARRAVDSLLTLTPEQVEVEQAPGVWQKQLASTVETGQRVRVLPGERIGLDGVVEQGLSAVNQASITGESLPVEKKPGDTLYAGTINGMGELQYRTQGRYDQSLLAKIAISVQQAQQSKAPVQRFVDQFSQIYTPVVTLLAIAMAVFGPVFFDGTWVDWLYKALVLLVIACPCALVISTPVAVVSALATAAKAGLLVKGGVHLERARKLDYLAVDKTGTITLGKPALQGQYIPAEYDESKVLAVAVQMANRSDHPASMALAQSLALLPLESPLQDFTAVAGAGVIAQIEGKEWRLGKLTWVVEQPNDEDSFKNWQQEWQNQGASFVFLAQGGQLMAAFAIADQIKPGVAQTITDLQALGVQVEMLSGDNRFAVQHIANEVGIKLAQGDLLPEQKLQIITERTQQYALSGMVGDGINDAPALAKADIGFAMGALGSDLAIETADIAIMNDKLSQIPYTVRLSKSLHAVLVQNISAALGIKLVFLVLALMGIATMWMAVFADVGASLLVVLNSLRLLKVRPSA